jgi:hypothetical protein
MKIQITVLLAGCLVFESTGCGQTWEQPKAKVTIQAKDEQGVPVNGATVRVGFTLKGTRQQKMLNGTTDIAGAFVGEGYSDIKLNADLRKEGYYLSSTGLVFTNATNGQWLPWNPRLVTVLRPIGKPVALYAKKVQTTLPVLNKPCGYDLEIGDWTMPYGKGMKKDLVFTILKKEVKGAGDFDVQGELTFSNPQDGILNVPISAAGKNSVFKWERQASENGYQPKFMLQNTWWESLGQKPIRSFKFGGKEWEGYFFRVRTVEQDGNIVSAHYGKIRGGIEIEPRETPTCTITFTYYFNPTPNDRNLEWDTKKNLFGGLSWEQSPREP